MKGYVALTALTAGLVFLAFLAGALIDGRTTTVNRKVVQGPHITIYIQNHASSYISTAKIRKDIPAWEKAANGSFSRAWKTPQVTIKMGKPRAGAASAVFVPKGSVQGALAYHRVRDGEPQIVVYAGTGKYYGYNNSVSFTHELFELLADPTTSQMNQGLPDSTVWVGQTPDFLFTPAIWFNEVCDPVESYAYSINHVQISDWITPNWFNDGVNGGFDHMDLIHQPLTVLRGGYAQYFDGQQWQVVQDFRHIRDADGYLKAEGVER
jgi:hypothetical protein